MTTPLQVLILEDREADAELMVHELQKAGYAPDWMRVETEPEFRRCLTPTVELVLADYSMPSFDAPGALKAMHESMLAAPMIIVSGSIGDERAVECLKLGAADYILKDRMARLGPAVSRVLADRMHQKERMRAEEALRRSEEQMRSILSTVEDVVWSMSLDDGRLLYLNPAAEKLTGRPVEAFLENPQRWLDTVHPDDHARMAQAEAHAVKWGTYEGTFRMVRPDGSIRQVQVRSWAAYGEKGEPLRLEGIFTDITDKKVAEEERRAHELAELESARLRGVNEFKSQFLNMVAHDLSNVLTPLRLNLRMVNDEVAKAGAQVPHLAGLKSGLERLGSFLADLLDAARLQSGKLTIAPVPFDLSSHLAQAVEIVKLQASEHGITVVANVPTSVGIQADPHRIEQVTSNLFSNALKFTPSGGTVTVALTDESDVAHFVVQDTGAGLAKQDIEMLFQPFSKVGTIAQGKHTGTGLGLFVCKGIVEGHGGRIWCESAGPGQGSAFHVTLPLNAKA